MLGARPLRRTIQREIEDTLSEKILFGELPPGHIVVVDAEDADENDESKGTFTFRGVNKPVPVVEAPPVEVGVDEAPTAANE